MAEDTSVKYYTSEMLRSPAINIANTHCLRDLLEACLVTGFGAVTANTVVVENGVCTITFNTGESFGRYSTVLISGATTKTSINGEHKVVLASSDWIKFNVSETNGTVTDSISVKYAPAGWELAFPRTTNDAVFRSTNPNSDRYCVRFSDYATNADTFAMYSSMIDNVTGLNETPSEATWWIRKAYGPAEGNRFWIIVASDSFFYYFISYRDLYSDDYVYQGYCFGDFITDFSENALQGHKTIGHGSYESRNVEDYHDYTNSLIRAFYSSTNGDNSSYFLSHYSRGFSQAKYTLAAAVGPEAVYTDVRSGNFGPIMDDKRGNINRYLPVYVTDEDQILGSMPGLYFFNNEYQGLYDNLTIKNIDGKLYILIYVTGGTVGITGTYRRINSSCVLLDITGPWS